MEPSLQVSVIVPTYNRGEMLRAALESVLAQTVPVGEIVVVDDGSTDDTHAIVESLAARDERAHVLYLGGEHTNRRGEVRNRGVAASSGDLLAFLDSDDLWKPERIERQLSALSRAPQAGFAFCNVQRFDENGPIGPPCLSPAARYDGRILGDMLEEPLAVSSTLLVRRQVFQDVGSFRDLRMNEDYELTLRLAAHSPANYVPDTLVLMREHPGRVSRSEREMPLLDYISIVEGFLAENPGLPTDVRARGRRGLANVRLKLARLYTELGDRTAAREQLQAVIKLRPWDRHALSAYLRSLAPA
jgi:glycosyltransferase involved in cell wall biosynthesis